MAEDFIRYDVLIENALREVVYKAMTKASHDGLLGDHHFYVTFQTGFPGVDVPDYLRKQYPEEMTIVLQYQFHDLKVDKEGFSVMLSFNNVRERLSIPFKAITTFADPSVNFALQFQSSEDDEEDLQAKGKAALGSAKAKGRTESGEEPKEEKRGEVISLDKFRKK
ncbi:MAG: ClpXP protease specificity-enhancing factor SspB [Alphaproteobacteria bacterium]|nr:ClpXP protease specificity-enhancing factor SspB [Alphaproteobacteria bacterium]